jgi:ligand-binding sensor domain-containing protein/serine phosphatase RsbU (regulator of sigma subunit)
MLKMKIFVKELCFLIVLLLLLFSNIQGQQNNFKVYSIDDGLPQSQVFSMLQDSRGYLWIGTNGGGLSRFDGLNFVTFTKKDGLTGNTIRCLLEDKRKNLWIATDNGLTFYNGLHFNSLTKKNGFSGTTVTSLFEDSQQNILAGTTNGGLNYIKFISKDSFLIKSYNKSNGIYDNFIFDIQIDFYGRIWLSTIGGINILTFFDNKFTSQWVKCPSVNKDELVLALAQDYRHDIYFGTENAGAFKINLSGEDSGKISSLNQIYDFHDKTIRDIVCMKNNDIWFATDKAGVEILKYNNKQVVHENYSISTGLPTNQILQIYQDRENNIWLGTNGLGLCRYIGDFFAHYTVKEGLSNNQVFGIRQDNDDNYWLATYGGGLTRYKLKAQKLTATSFTTKNGLPDNFLSSIDIAPDNTLWIATANKGICSFKNEQFNYYTTENGLCDNHVNCIYVDTRGYIWCGTQGGINRFDGKSFFSITESNGLINNEVQTIIEDKFGVIWFGTLGGLVKIEGRSMTDYDVSDGLTEMRINSLATDQSGNIWIGTFGGGLFKFNRSAEKGKPIQQIAVDSLLSSNNIVSLLFQDNNILIAGTDRGFDKLYLDKNQNIASIAHYDKSNGFSGTENNLNAIYKDKTGLIWFGTIKGLTSYNPLKENSSILLPQTHIVDLNLFFEEINWKNLSDSVKPWFNLPQHLKLSYNKNHLTFKFIGISLSNPSKISYSFKLEGWDKDWSPAKKNTEITYSGLAPGEYTFMVKAQNEKGIWNKEPIKFSFEIKPPFWKTNWFIILSIISIIFIIVFYIKYREKNLLKEKNKLEQKVVERTKEITKQKLEIEEKNKDILDSIEYAKRIQDALLPAENILEHIFADYFILFKPRNIVSGDFYWITATDNKLILAVADCTGHGVPGAFMSMLGVAFLNEIVKKNSVDQADLVLDQLRIHVMETLHNASDGMDMALGIFDIDNRKLQYAGAYNPVYLIRNNELSELAPDKMPIGYHTTYTEGGLFNKKDIDLNKNDIIYLFTDGYKDQFGGSESSKIKARQFRQWLLEIHQLPMKEQKDILEQKYENWKGNNEQTDDVCVVGIKIK